MHVLTFRVKRPAARRRNGNNPWVHGHTADPFLALLIAILISPILAGATRLVR
jgi:hypothetical protein